MNIRASNINTTSFVVQWDKVDDADQYIVNWRANGDDVERTFFTPNASCTMRGLTPNTNYSVTVTAKNFCGNGTINIFFLVTSTNGTVLVTPSISLFMSSTESTNLYNPTTMTSPTGM